MRLRPDSSIAAHCTHSIACLTSTGQNSNNWCRGLVVDVSARCLLHYPPGRLLGHLGPVLQTPGANPAGAARLRSRIR